MRICNKKTNRLYSKNGFQMFFFFLFPAAMFVSLVGKQKWRLRTELNKFVWNIWTDNSNTGHLDLGLEQVVFFILLIFYKTSNSKHHSVNYFDFKFLGREGEK